MLDARSRIGRASVRVKAGAWPRDVTLRFAAFRQLERMQARSGGRRVECFLARLEDARAEHRCRGENLDGTPRVVASDGGFELVLPPGFVAEQLAREWMDEHVR
ncbi:MAG: hypothetical protein WCA12_17655 [Burkholderiales bacterium]